MALTNWLLVLACVLLGFLLSELYRISKLIGDARSQPSSIGTHLRNIERDVEKLPTLIRNVKDGISPSPSRDPDYWPDPE